METKNSVTPTPAAPEPAYEWGVRYRAYDEEQTLWGFYEDPTLSGVIDEEGDIEISSYYHPVIAVGKRPVGSEVWNSYSHEEG
jgi:hypothetical protein